MQRVAIAVMAKAPVPGRCKTRMQPALTAQEAAGLSENFLRDITENLRQAGLAAPIDGFVAYAPADSEHLFAGLLAPATQTLLADGNCAVPAGIEGFGRCLWHATTALFARNYAAVCVLNADSPTLPTAYLVQAANLLLSTATPAHAVLGPAEDGGYYLLGTTQPHPALLQNISWSTEKVAAQTRAQAAASAITLHELPPWYDADEALSLTRLAADIQAPGPRFAAPATATFLAELGFLRGGQTECAA